MAKIQLKILIFTYINRRIKCNLNNPSWLEKCLNFNCIKWLKSSFIDPMMMSRERQQQKIAQEEKLY